MATGPWLAVDVERREMAATMDDGRIQRFGPSEIDADHLSHAYAGDAAYYRACSTVEGMERRLRDLDKAEGWGEWKGTPVGEAAAWSRALREWRGPWPRPRTPGCGSVTAFATRRPEQPSGKARCGSDSRSLPLPSG